MRGHYTERVHKKQESWGPPENSAYHKELSEMGRQESHFLLQSYLDGVIGQQQSMVGGFLGGFGALPEVRG